MCVSCAEPRWGCGLLPGEKTECADSARPVKDNVALITLTDASLFRTEYHKNTDIKILRMAEAVWRICFFAGGARMYTGERNR